MTILIAFEGWVAFCRYAERFGYTFAPRDDARLGELSSHFLRAALCLAPGEQFILRERMHEYGCPYALHLYESKVLDDLLAWRPSPEQQPLLGDIRDFTRTA